jgi:hypothetical protein
VPFHLQKTAHHLRQGDVRQGQGAEDSYEDREKNVHDYPASTRSCGSPPQLAGDQPWHSGIIRRAYPEELKKKGDESQYLDADFPLLEAMESGRPRVFCSPGRCSIRPRPAAGLIFTEISFKHGFNGPTIGEILILEEKTRRYR